MVWKWANGVKVGMWFGRGSFLWSSEIIPSLMPLGLSAFQR